MSDGTPWRPLVHVEDIGNACIAVLEAPREVVFNEAFNVGQDSENFQVKDIAEIIQQTVPGSEIEYAGENKGDPRSYRVSFAKINERLPGYQPRWTLKQGAEELYRFLQDIEISTDIFHDRKFTRLTQLQYLLACKRIGTDLFWNCNER